MKRLSLLAAALIMVLGMAVSASAAPEVSISGNLLVNAVWMNNWDFRDGTNDGAAMDIVERADLYFTVTANENLKGVLGLRSDKGSWGDADFGLDRPGGADRAQLNIRDAYIDFNWPGTDVNVKAGIYTVALPQSVGSASMILAERAGAVMVSAPVTDNVSVLAGYTRLFNDNNTTGNTLGAVTDGEDFLDGYLVAVPLSFEGVSATPFFLYANGGQNFAANNEEITAYWTGTNFTMSLFDPFIIKADVNYGNLDADTEALDASGWLFDLGLDYTGFDFMNVSAYFVYTTGNDDDAANGAETMPILNGDWAVGSFFFGGGSITSDDINGGDTPMGFWTIGLSLTDIQSFAQGLTHDFHVLYAKGTNDSDLGVAGQTLGSYLTDDDSLWEVDFNTAYAVYDELTLYGQLGYINSDFDDDVWGNNVDNDAWKFATGVVYKF
ncbi:outer membrane homotrimeric porin [uncultured Pseudodesulfovibrio sp.]|uniref:outer membrane homotrimeric porin n=1 Tax=uncultured Pseudodesulfovibrio sp. TaxID=2035858 RepID=UPI0029C9A191|nr:outer membrane homotrimeric porin [uncultured Pseudodesulfovibrio sp.]